MDQDYEPYWEAPSWFTLHEIRPCPRSSYLPGIVFNA